MSEYFSDPLSETRQDLYWQVLQPKITLDEWAYACLQAMMEETFYKVPLVAHLMEHVRAYRRAQRELVLREQCAEGVRTRGTLLALRDSLVDPAEVKALIASVWPNEPPQATTPVVPARPRPWRLTPEELTYTPTTDSQAAKTKLREQVRQILEARDRADLAVELDKDAAREEQATRPDFPAPPERS